MGKKLLSDLNNKTGDYGYRSEARIAPKNKRNKAGSKAGRVFGVFLALIQLAASVYFASKVYSHIPISYMATLTIVLIVFFAISLFTQTGKSKARTFGKIFAVITTISLILASIFSDKVIADLMRLSGNKTVDVDTPFVVFVSAADDFGEYDNSVNTRSDTNILAIVNPKTYTVLLVSTPRDYYVRISGKSIDSNASSSYDKLTHAGLYGSGIAYDSNGKKLHASDWNWAYDVISAGGKWGTPDMYDEDSKVNGFSAIMNTLKDLYSIDIAPENYSYVRLNFTGFGRLIDAMDGIDVNVKEGFTTRTYSNYENNEGRSDYTFSKGKQHLNGIEALTFARERKKVSGGDMGRNKNQVKVIKAMADKGLSASTYITNNYNKIIKAVGDAFTTDMDIVSLVDFQSSIMSQGEYDGWNILSYSVVGTPASNQTMWDGAYRSTVLQDEESVSHAKTLIQMTLNGDQPKTIKKKIKQFEKQ